MKRLVILAGPNGAGKTTLSTLIADALQDIERDDILNPDRYAGPIVEANKGAAPEQLRQMLWAEMERQRTERLRQGKSFALETNFTYPDKLELLDLAHENGYETFVMFIALSSPELAIKRVARRVARGGHPIEDDKVRKRWSGGLRALDVAVNKANFVMVIDNSIEYSEDVLPVLFEPVFTFANGVLEKVGNQVPLYLLRWLAHYRPEAFLASLVTLGPPNETA